MVGKEKIICPHCGLDTEYTYDQFRYLVLTHDICCPHCNRIIISKVKHYEWRTRGLTNGPILTTEWI